MCCVEGLGDEEVCGVEGVGDEGSATEGEEMRGFYRCSNEEQCWVCADKKIERVCLVVGCNLYAIIHSQNALPLIQRTLVYCT